MDLPEEEEVDFESEEEIEVYYEDANDPNDLEEPPAPARPIPRRASLANDTQGGPAY
jgi:hypothetical protein